MHRSSQNDHLGRSGRVQAIRQVMVRAPKYSCSTNTETVKNSPMPRHSGLRSCRQNFFAGKINIPNGLAPVNLIHLTDCIDITRSVINYGITSCIINAVAPHHPTKIDFYKEAAKRSGLNIPEFILEKTKWKIVNSIYLSKLIPYKFKIDNWFEYFNGNKI